MNSHGNLIFDKNRKSLNNDSIDKLAVLKKNTKLLKNTGDQCTIAQNLKLSNS